MSFSRRRFLAYAAAASAGCVASRFAAALDAGQNPRPDTLDPSRLAAFVDPLPLPPRARPLGDRPDPDDPARRLAWYRLEMTEIHHRLHRDLPPTRLWSFGGASPGPTFETRAGEGLLVEWANALPPRHFLPVDHTLPGAGADLPPVRAVTHVHGARVPAASDGYPEHWFVPGQARLCHYPNRQDAALLYYHDHAVGLNRLNVYAGMFGLFIIRDAAEEQLGLPAGDFEVPLVFCDRFLDPRGQLFYPVSGKSPSSWVPEVAGNALLVNGALYPYLDVEPRLYRLRWLNAANGRFFHLSFSNHLQFRQIGTDQGLLPAQVPRQSLTLAPAERADLLVDFGGRAGERIVLANQSMPMMQFRVGGRVRSPSVAVPAALRPLVPIPEASAVRTRRLTLDEYDDREERPMMMLLGGKYWHDPVTENPVLGTTEIWELVNLTDDAHPIHLHLARFQILDRRAFDVDLYLANTQMRYTAAAVPPGAEEAGWKDTVRAPAGAVTRIIIPFEGYAGRYLWHCHILEHESNAMMRPFQVLPAAAEKRANLAVRPVWEEETT